MSSFYRIKDWSNRYETNETRKLKSLLWVKMPNQQDGLAYRLISKEKNGPAIFAAWCLMLQMASKASPRGELKNNNLPLSPGDMGDVTGFPAEIFAQAIKFLSSPKIGWIEEISPSPDVPGENPDAPGKSPATPPIDGMEWNGMEEKGMEVSVGKKKHGGFTPPTIFEVIDFCQSRENGIDAAKWYSFYQANGWMVGKNKMKDWKAAVRYWEKNQKNTGNAVNPTKRTNFETFGSDNVK